MSSNKGKSSKTPQEETSRSIWQRLFVRRGIAEAVYLPVLAVFTALIIGAIIIVFSDITALQAWKQFFHNPWGALRTSWVTIRDAYSSMFLGAFGNPVEVIKQLANWIKTGESRPFLDAFRPFSEGLVLSTPYILAGLGVALGFRGGLFNIGAEGQLFVSGMAAAFVGYSIVGLPWYLHLPLTILTGALAGAIWGAIPGFLKARFGAHEVINTIMMNYIAFRLTEYLLAGPMAKPGGTPMTPLVQPSAYLPTLFPAPVRLHWGFFIALALAGIVYWFLWKTSIGMEIRMTGANPRAARYAGVSVTKITVLTMALSGALCGLAGAIHMLGVDHKMVRSFSTGYGFDAIALALLGNSHPLGVVLSSLLFGFLRSGASRMQSVAGTPVEIIRVIQGMIIVFIAAPDIIRSLYRLRSKRRLKQAAVTDAGKP